MRISKFFILICFCQYAQADLGKYAIVDCCDLAVLSINWLTEADPNTNDVANDSDFNNDDITNLNDFNILARYWLKTPRGYNNANVLVWPGKYEYRQVDGEPALFPGKTYGFISDKFGAAGRLRTVRIKLYTDNGILPVNGIAKLKLLSGISSPFNLKADIDITAAVNLAKQQTDAHGNFDFEYDFISFNINASPGDFLAVYFPENITCVRLASSANTNSEVVYCNSGGDAVSSPLPLDYQINGHPYLMDYQVDTNDFIIFDENSGFNAGSYIDVPAFKDESQYLIFEDVYVPSGQNLKADLCSNFDDESNSVLKTIELSFRSSNRYIAFDDNVSLIHAYGGNKYNIHVWIDPRCGRIDMFYVNTSMFDIRHVSMTCRKPLNLTPRTYIRRIKIYQDYGTAASVKRIVVCRKPILAIGDSFVSTYNGDTHLNHVGKALTKDGVFSKKRYVINGGITGNRVLTSGPAAAITIRWDGYNNDLCAYRDVVATFVNGPGLNDIGLSASSTSQEIEQKAQDMAQGVINMVAGALAIGDKFGGQNNVIMCEQVPCYAYKLDDYQKYLNRKICQERFNSLLSQFAVENGIAFARVYEDMPDTYYSSDGVHPNSQGDLWIAERIALSYEEN